MKIRTILLILAITPLSLKAQSSIGFRNAGNIKPVLDYRLPSWGYRRLSAGFRFNGQSSSTESGNPHDPRRSENSFDLQFSPDFSLYHESENFIQYMHFDAASYFSGRHSENAQTYNTMREYNISSNLNYRLSAYLNPLLYLILEGSLSPDYNDELQRTPRSPSADPESRATSVNKRIEASLKLGFGLGRVRDVTPLIRALRMAERYRALGKGDTLTPAQVQGMAGTLASRSGYSYAFDRWEKYFWRDLFTGVRDVDGMSPFEFNYLKEALGESIGARYQGAQVSACLVRGLDEQWRKNRDPLSEYRYDSHETSNSLGFLLQGSWYRNISLAHQIGIRLSGNSTRFFGELHDDLYTWNHDLSCSGEHLYVLSDRILWRNSLQVQQSVMKRDQIRKTDKTFTRMYFSTDLTYYLEDKLSLSTSLDAQWINDHEKLINYKNRNRNVTLSMGLQYHLIRGME